MKINKSAFNKEKVEFNNLNYGDIFLVKEHVFMKMTHDSLPTVLDLKNNQLEIWNTSHVEVYPLKVKIFLGE